MNLKELGIDFYQLMVVATICGFTILAVLVFRYFFNRFVKQQVIMSGNDPTRYRFISHLITALIYIIGFGWAFSQIDALRTLAASLLAGAGIAAVAVGFASQAALSNIIGGMFIVLFKPYRINDRITLTSGRSGVVEDITLRHTVIKDFENRRIIIPNSVISNETLVNADLSDGRIIKWIDVGISYNSDIDHARQIIREEIMAHPLLIDGRNEEQIQKGDPQVPVRVISLGESSVNLRAWAWVASQQDSAALGWDTLESIKKRFDKEGIEIPFPHRTVYVRKDSEQ